MKRQKPHVDHDKRRQRRVLIFSIILIVIMIGSTFAYYIVDRSSDSSSRLDYGDYEFSYKGLGDSNYVLVTDINGQEVEFQSLPTQVGYLPVEQSAIELLKSSQQVVLTRDANLTFDEAATIDYARLQLGLAIPKTINAMAQENEQYSLPVITCDMASPQLPVIMFNISNESSVQENDGCIVVSGEGREIMLLKDRIIFEYYGLLSNGSLVD